MSVSSASDMPNMGVSDESEALTQDILPYFTQSADAQSIWSSEQCDQIYDRRLLLPDQHLFYDELLSYASIDVHLYPPRSTQQLTQLISAIFDASSLDYLKQLSLVYYLMLDLDAYLDAHAMEDMVQPRAVSKAQQFANTYIVLPNFCLAMQGYWLLDRDEYHNAVPLLSIADFIPKIVRTLFSSSSSSRSRTDVERAKLLLRFLHVSSYLTTMALDSEHQMQEIEMYIQALCFVSGPMRAFNEIRALTSSIDNDDDRRVSMRARLIFKVLEHCFAPPRAAAIHSLLGCSLDPEEEVALESFILSPPPAMTATWSYIAADVLIIRYINQGRYMDAVGLDRRLGPDVSQGHTTDKNAHQRAKMAEQRKRMIAGAREILPEVQKEILRMEESAELKDSQTPQPQQQTEAEDLSIKAVHQHVLTPLSASPAARQASSKPTPSTQAAILSAVVRASASANSTPRKSFTPRAGSPSVHSLHATPTNVQEPTAMIGFLAQHATRQQQQIRSDDETMGDGGAVLEEVADDKSPAPAPEASTSASPWRNTPTLTSTSPFSGLPKIPKPNFSTAPSPFRRSSGSYPPTAGSPFAAPSSRSMSASPSTKLPGAIGLVSRHGQRSRLGGKQVSYDDDDDDMEEQDDRSEINADDTFIDVPKTDNRAKQTSELNIGRLIPGRRDWTESNEADQDQEMQDSEEMTSGPPAKRRTRAAKKAPNTPATEGKMTRSQTGANLKGAANGGKMTKSRSDASLAGTPSSRRTTRSATSVHRKPLTLSNLEQHYQDQSQTDAVPAGPIARRTRAATAERESVNGNTVNDAASTIYTISEVGGAGNESTPARRRTKKASAATPSSTVRRSTRLTSTEPEFLSGPPEMSEVSPTKRRTTSATGRKLKMPGGLD